MNRKALQLYTVRQALAENVAGTLRRVRAAGYRCVEVAPLPPELDARTFAESLKREELSVIGVHADLPWGADQERVLDWAEGLGCRRIVWHGWPRAEECATIAGFERLADRYHEVATVLRGRGFEFGLHNHWWEYELLEGQYPYRVLAARLAPEIFWEVDVYWVRTAGMNPAAVLSELGSRVRMVHLKDGPAVHGQPMTALGRGVVDLGEVLRAAPAGVDWVVELDECATDPLEAARESLTNLDRWLAAGWRRSG